jgi:tetraacyldisaccharide 4'-kinase
MTFVMDFRLFRKPSILMPAYRARRSREAALRSFEERLREIWKGERMAGATGALAAALRLMSFPYGAAVAVRSGLYDRGLFRQVRLPCPVISVGNLTVGGTGKTPTVILLAKLLKDRGRCPAILSRGYGGRAKAPVNVVSDGDRILLSWQEAGDEPVLMARSVPGVPVLTGPKRAQTGRVAIEQFGADVLVLDDAFQHRALSRDLDILLLDAAHPFGNGFLLPRGPLRERPQAAGRAHLVIRTGTTEEGSEPPMAVNALSLPAFRGIHRPRALVEAQTGRILPLGELYGKKVCAFAGIGHPEALRRSLAELGAGIASFKAYPDHHPYSRPDIEALEGLAHESGAEKIVTTEKDGVRLADFPDFLPKILLLRIGMEVTPAESFTELIFSRLAY